jgi:hypothetical protein
MERYGNQLVTIECQLLQMHDQTQCSCEQVMCSHINSFEFCDEDIVFYVPLGFDGLHSV